MSSKRNGVLVRRNSAYIQVILRNLEEVEEAPRLGKLIVFVENSGVGLGQIVGGVFPVDFSGLEGG